MTSLFQRPDPLLRRVRLRALQSLGGLFPSPPEAQLSRALCAFLDLLGVSVRPETVRLALETSHRFPGFSAAMDALETLGVRTRSVRAGANALETVATPALAPLRGGSIAVVIRAERGAIHWVDAQGQRRADSIQDFGQLWTGVLVLGEVKQHRSARVAHTERVEHLRTWLRRGLLGLGLAAGSAAAGLRVHALFADSAAVWLGLAVLKILGLVASAALVVLSVNRSSPLSRRLCPAGGRADCSDVLSSPGAYWLGWIPAADVGLVYFAGGIFALVLSALQGYPSPAIPLLSCLTLLALPYTAFSIAYQALALRRWCWICVAVQALIWSELLWLGCQTAISAPGLADAVPLALLSFGLPALAWAWMRPRWAKGFDADRLSRELARLRRHPAIVERALQSAPACSDVSLATDVTWGSDEAALHLVMIAHTHCPACARGAQLVERFVATYPGALRCTVRLYPEGDPRRGVIAERVHLLALGREPECARRALQAWFENPQQSPAAWLERFPAPRSLCAERASEAREELRRWLLATGNPAAPAYFANSRVFPRELDLEALLPFLRAHDRRARMAS